MFEIEKFLKEIDLDNLGKKLSQKRNSFTDNINPTQHEIINKKQLFCAVSLDLCFRLFQEYMTTYLNNLNKLNEIEENRLESYSETLSEVTQSHEELIAKYPNRQEAEQTFEPYELILTNLYLRLSHASDMNEVNALAYMIRIDILNLSLIGIVESFELLLSQNDPALSKEKIKSTVKLAFGLVGLVPTIFTLPFSLVSLCWDIYDKMKIEETRVGTATDILTQLDSFANSTFAWSVHAQTLIDFDYIGANLQGTLDDKTRLYESLLENAKTVVNNKIGAIYNNINNRARDIEKSKNA